MNSINRKTTPEFKSIGKTSLFKPEELKLKNGIPLYVFNLHDSELIKFEMIFEAGNWNLSKPLAGLASAKLMDDGTRRKTSKEIAEEIDFYGSYYSVSVQSDFVSIELFTLRKFLSKTLPILLEILTEAIFPESEIKIFQVNNIQKILVDEQKVQKIGTRLFLKSLFGGNSKYGHGEHVEDYEKLGREEILESYGNVFHNGNCILLASGKIGDIEIKVIENIFGLKAWGKFNPKIMEDPTANYYNTKPEYVFKETQNASQSALKIGKPLVPKSHPDFPFLGILNTVLGGYFGSRLMNNIREDKGLTYGIGSNINPLKNLSFFYISTEVNADSTKEVILEINKEIEILQKDLISVSELELVKNFMRGSFLGSLENAFSYADKFKSLYFHKLDYTYYDVWFEAINKSNPNQLRALAQQYWDRESFHTVIVGKE